MPDLKEIVCPNLSASRQNSPELARRLIEMRNAGEITARMIEA